MTRQETAEMLVRQLLERPLSRLTPLSDEFITAMGKIVMAHFVGMRASTAEKLVRQLLELPLSRLKPLSDGFVADMAEIVLGCADLDAQRQHWKE